MMKRWTALWDHREHPRVIALVRVVLACSLLADFLRIQQLDMVVTLFGPHTEGGINNALERPVIPPLYRWFPASASTAVLVHAGVCLSALTFALGLFTRASGLLLLLLHAQLALVLPLGDRGIEMLMRNVLLILLFSQSHRCYSIDAWRKTGSFAGDATPIPAWPRHLVILQLVVVYGFAGFQKTGLDWTPMGEFSALYIVLQDPAIALFDHSRWTSNLYLGTQVATAMTMLFEVSAPLLLLVYHFRTTPEKGGRVRKWVLAHNPHYWWMGFGACLHIGIACTMALGIFPWAILGLYLAFLHPDEIVGISAWFGQARARAARPG